MTSHNMDHMKFLSVVAADDLAVLEKKEGTYQGSWKRSGGRSAWFMIKRLLDRITTMATRPETPPGFSMEDLMEALDHSEVSGDDAFVDTSILRYLQKCYVAENIFALIRSGPGGEDGTPLAVLRDIRRYLMLVEAEMMSRGVVHPELVDVKMTEARSFGETIQVGQETANELAALIKKAASAYIDPEPFTMCPGRHYLYTSPIALKQYVAALVSWKAVNNPSNGLSVICEVSLGNQGYLTSVPPKQLMGPLPEKMDDWEPQYQKMKMEQWPPIGMAAALPIVMYEGERTPEDGAQAASLAPWVVDSAWRHRKGMEDGGPMQEIFYEYWRTRSSNLWVLEPVVQHVIPPSYVVSLYLRAENHYWVLNIADCPPDAREFFPYLPSELNSKAREESPDWQQVMYTWSESETKWRLDPKHHAWMKD